MSAKGDGGAADAIEIRPLTQLADFERCVELQIAVWGYSDGDVIPRRVFVVAERIGGQAFGAFADGTMIGFAMGLPGYRDRTAYLHSHMLAVLPEFRNAGLGRRLKLAQRADAIERGFELMEWTFDPLEIRNAHLNLHRLGAICRRYQRDFYGPSSSPLQGGLPTDRLYAEWWLRSAHVESTLHGEEVGLDEAARVDVPKEIYTWKADGSEKALETQGRVRDELLDGFGRGLAAVGYERDAEGNGRYLLGVWDEASKDVAVGSLQGRTAQR